jgi:hypothetical protein
MRLTFYRILLLTSWLVGQGLVATAQNIPNNGFETWASPSTVEQPAGWRTTDDIVAYYSGGNASDYNLGAVTKSTDVHGGSFAAKLTTVNVPTTTGNVLLPGILLAGTKLGGRYTIDGYPLGGVPYTARPTQIQFYYKLTGPAADSAVAVALLTSTSATGTVTAIGGAAQILAPTTGGYAAITLPIQYTSSAMPDSVRILFASGDANKITVGTTLLLDDITFSGAPLAVRANADVQEQLTVSPNPSAGGRFQLSAPSEPALASAPYTILDVTGRVVARQPGLAVPSPTRDVDLSSLMAGIYMLRVDSKQGILVRQLVVK